MYDSIICNKHCTVSFKSANVTSLIEIGLNDKCFLVDNAALSRGSNLWFFKPFFLPVQRLYVTKHHEINTCVWSSRQILLIETYCRDQGNNGLKRLEKSFVATPQMHFCHGVFSFVYPTKSTQVPKYSGFSTDNSRQCRSQTLEIGNFRLSPILVKKSFFFSNT